MFALLSILTQLIYFIACCHYFQWKGYYKKRYLKYLFKNKLIILINLILLTQILLNLLNLSINFNIFIFDLFIFIFNIIILELFLFKKKKIKFIFTNRIFRLLGFNCVCTLLLCFSCNIVSLAIIILTPLILILLDCIDIYKYTLNHKCLTEAVNKLNSNPHLIVVGITGSNGKTSVKEILRQLLSTKYNVATTAKNENTPKGAINAINNYITNDTEIFICEMGARSVGDITKMCNLVNPTKAIITSVCTQHIETFKSEQNIYLTKKELPDYIQDGFCVYNIDNKLCGKMHNEKYGAKCSVSACNSANIYATNIHLINFQTYFDINYQGNIYPCHTQLLGQHNVINILLALSLALHLGIDINTCINTIVNLKPIPHRLQYVKSHIDIIDDSYNCSIDSAKMAFNVLCQINKIKVVCTPGIIEGGKMQYSLNQQLSSRINNTADIAIIVGKTNRKALVSQLNNFELIYITSQSLNTELECNKKCAYIVDTLSIAQKLFSRILNSNHVLLLLNDLPDEYN